MSIGFNALRRIFAKPGKGFCSRYNLPRRPAVFWTNSRQDDRRSYIDSWREKQAEPGWPNMDRQLPRKERYAGSNPAPGSRLFWGLSREGDIRSQILRIADINLWNPLPRADTDSERTRSAGIQSNHIPAQSHLRPANTLAACSFGPDVVVNHCCIHIPHLPTTCSLSRSK